jgi:hypothetical protein
VLIERLKRQKFQIEFRSHAEAMMSVEFSCALAEADGAKAIRYLTFHSAVTAETEWGYCGETWAELDGAECGHVKWHSDEHTTSIDYIETGGQVPLLGVRLLKAVWDVKNNSSIPV